MKTHETTYLRGLEYLIDGKNITRVAKLMGISGATLHSMVTCRRGASLTTALIISRYFKVSIEKLVSPPRYRMVAPVPPLPDEKNNLS